MRSISNRLRLMSMLAVMLLVALCLLPTGQQASSETVTANEKNVLVGFASTPGDREASLITSLGGHVTHRYKYIPVFAATIPETHVDILAANPDVAYVENDYELYMLGAGKQVSDYGITKIEAPGAWGLGYRGSQIKVGIFDSGIDLEHPDLSDAIAGGVDLIGDGNGFDDCNGHGTHVAGIVGARDNGTGSVGVAPRVSLYAMRFFDCVGGGATTAREIRGIEWAIDNGMQVINMSFGCCSIVQQGQRVVIPLSNAAEEAAMNAAYQRGIVLIAASGNGFQIGPPSPVGGSFGEPVVSYPAAYPTVVAVGATDDEDNLATFSQYGIEQELTAPGVNNFSSVPVGTGQTTDVSVDSDNGRELEAIGMQLAGLTKKSGIAAQTIYAGFGSSAEFAGVQCLGKTALVTRGGVSTTTPGTLTFAEKVLNAMNAGCSAVIIHNNQPGNFAGTLGTATTSDGRAWIPAVSISLDEGLYLKNQIDSRATFTTLLNVIGNHAVFSG
ncbi:MAG TPA: S8 family serine peptidase, partial [Pyrinomonadaceae bacterium]